MTQRRIRRCPCGCGEVLGESGQAKPVLVCRDTWGLVPYDTRLDLHFASTVEAKRAAAKIILAIARERARQRL